MPCPPHYAYRIACADAQAVADLPVYRNSLSLIGHCWTRHPRNDGTILMTLPGGSPCLDDYGPAIDTGYEGAQLLPPPDLDWVRSHAAWRQLQREDAPPSVDVTMCSGHVVSVALGLAAPQLIEIQPGGRAQVGAHTTDLGRLAWQLFDRYSNPEPGITDEQSTSDTGWLQYLALSAIYALTPEACNIFEILTTGDVSAMLCAIWGADPKASAAADDTSPSPAADSSATPS